MTQTAARMLRELRLRAAVHPLGRPARDCAWAARVLWFADGLIRRFPGGALSVERASGGIARRQQGQDTVDDGFDAKAGGVDEDGLFGRPQRSHRAIGIAGVARENFA